MTERIKLGFIGCGRRGRPILKAIAAQDGLFEVAALCDTAAENMDGAIQYVAHEEADRCGAAIQGSAFRGPVEPVDLSTAARYTDYRALLAECAVDAVVIASPTYTHYEIILAAIEAGVHIYSEKPLAPDVAQLMEIHAACQRSPKVFEAGLQMRYSNIFQKTKQLIESGRIGVPHMAYFYEFRKPFSFDWQYLRSQSGGTFLEKNIHHFDIFNWLLDSEPVQVFASGGQNVIKKGDIIDNAWVTVDYASGARAMLGVGLFAPRQIRQFGVLGDAGFLRDVAPYENAGSMNYALRLWKAESLPYSDTPTEHVETFEFSMVDYVRHTQGAVADFARCVRDGARPLAGIDAAVRSSLVCFAAERSMRENRVVRLDEITQTVEV